MIDISQNVDYDRAIVGAAPPLGWRRRRVGMAARWEAIEQSALRQLLDRVPGVGKSETRTVRNETVVKSLKTINSAKLVIRRPLISMRYRQQCEIVPFAFRNGPFLHPNDLNG